MNGAVIFGKLPAHGDFVARGMDFARRQALDNWLTASLQAARERYADDWRTRFDQAPAWLFAAATDDGFEAGAICPSIDRAGRRFPLFVGVPVPDRDGLPALAGHVQECLYAALGERLTVDALAAYLARPVPEGTQAISTPDAIGDGRWWAVDVRGAVVASLPGRHPSDLLGEMLGLCELETGHGT